MTGYNVRRRFKGADPVGTIRGVYQEVYETPLEYAQKLAAKYSRHKDVFQQIVISYYREIYGEKSLHRDEVSLVRKSLRGLP